VTTPDVTGLELIGSGREADVYAFDAGRVLRRYRTGADAEGEAEIMAYLAGHGYPVPHVSYADGPDLVLERLDGATMAQALLTGALDLDTGAALLARLHRDLHAVPPRWCADPDDRILHLDLHPENVLLTGRGPVVIDWHNATEGPPDYDTAVSALILAELVVAPRSELTDPVRAFLTAFLGAAGGHPGRMLDRALARRRSDPTRTAAELAALPCAGELVAQLLGDAADGSGESPEAPPGGR